MSPNPPVSLTMREWDKLKVIEAVASEITALDALDVFGKIGLVEHLSSQRANGLRSMIKRIREEARVRTAA